MTKGSILIVDDEEVILRNLESLFGRDYHVLTARSAAEAMGVMRRETIHVVVSDYKMPGQDGLSFLIDAKGKFPGTIRALMTAYADMNLVVRALNEGEIHRFISKPFKSFEFRAMLDDCLRLSSILQKDHADVKAGKVVLIGHDSQISLSTLRIILGASYRILSTSNGLEVLGLVSANPVDALVVGIGLEMLDGCTITSYLKKEKGVDFPVVIWSRNITGPFEEHLRDCGADYWIDEGSPDASTLLREYLQDQLD